MSLSIQNNTYFNGFLDWGDFTRHFSWKYKYYNHL